MKKPAAVNIRVLCATDLHQSVIQYQALHQAVLEQKPNVVALVGDFLHFWNPPVWELLPVAECAEKLAELPAEHLLFVRGNHEDQNWGSFVSAWPHQRRELTALYGSAYTVGPLTMIGFPCLTGDESHWCKHLSGDRKRMKLNPESGVPSLPVDTEKWLPKVLEQTGPAGRTLWLMHECPMALPISRPDIFNPAWTDAVEKYSPLLTISGHDHDTPRGNNTWHDRYGDTVCVNAGQAKRTFHYVLVDFEFPAATACLPTRVKIRAFPWNKEISV